MAEARSLQQPADCSNVCTLQRHVPIPFSKRRREAWSESCGHYLHYQVANSLPVGSYRYTYLSHRLSKTGANFPEVHVKRSREGYGYRFCGPCIAESSTGHKPTCNPCSDEYALPQQVSIHSNSIPITGTEDMSKHRPSHYKLKNRIPR